MSIDYSLRLRRVLWWIIGFSLILHVVALILGHTVFAQWRWIHLPVHAAAEMSGSVIALMVAWFLHSLHRRGEGTSYNLVIAGALVAMGVLDGMHALEKAGKIFVWLHSTATLAGGIFFVLIWVPARWQPKSGRRWLASIFVVAVAFGAVSMTWRDWVPPMVVDGRFTFTAQALNVGGGILMLLAASRLFFTYQGRNNIDDLLFCLHTTLFGAAAIMFEQSVLWDLPWWGWHMLRLLAYVVALWFILLADLRAQFKLQEARDQFAELTVTLEQRVEERTRELRHREAESRTIIEATPTGMIMADRDGKIVRLNEAAAGLFGYDREALLGQSIDKLVPLENRNSHMQGRKRFFPESGPRRDLHGKNKDGSLIPIDIGLNPLTTAEGEHVLASIIDLTERKRTQEELQTARDSAEAANRAKSEFLANMSHEIRTPMNGIMGMTELLMATELKQQQRGYVALVSQSADSLLTIINDILDYSKIEAGKLELDPHEFDLRDSIGDTMHILGFRAQEKNLELAYQVQSNVPDCLVGDLGRVRQILVNLVGNAIKFTTEGEVFVDVQLESQTADSVSLHFLVRDSGIGIPPDRQKAIFESFTQAEGSTTRIHGGTGLGLTISRKLVDLMKGRIWVDSKTGEGSTFHFTVGLTIGSERCFRSPPETLKGLSVLVIDDNATNRQILEAMVSNWEMTPDGAPGGVEGLVKLQAAQDSGEPVRLVLLDLMMPEMDGMEVAREIQKIFGEEAPEILMLSSSGQHIAREQAEKLGINRALTKPVKQLDLLDAITRLYGVATRDEKGAEREIAERPEEITPMKVLLAEDGRVNQMVAVSLLEERGHSVIVANDGQEAVDLHKRESFDAILMDVQMPRLDGYDATGVIRERELESGAHIPIIAMTANAMKGDREKCLEAGMDDYIPKPVRSAELFSTLEKFSTGTSVKGEGETG